MLIPQNISIEDAYNKWERNQSTSLQKKQQQSNNETQKKAVREKKDKKLRRHTESN